MWCTLVGPQLAKVTIAAWNFGIEYILFPVSRLVMCLLFPYGYNDPHLKAFGAVKITLIVAAAAFLPLWLIAATRDMRKADARRIKRPVMRVALITLVVAVVFLDSFSALRFETLEQEIQRLNCLYRSATNSSQTC